MEGGPNEEPRLACLVLVSPSSCGEITNYIELNAGLKGFALLIIIPGVSSLNMNNILERADRFLMAIVSRLRAENATENAQILHLCYRW